VSKNKGKSIMKKNSEPRTQNSEYGIRISAFCIIISALIVTGCTTTPVRVDTGGSGSFTTMGLDITDLMDTATRATQELMVHPSIAQFEAKNRRVPLIEFAPVVNSTRERINIEQVSGRVTEELLNSGQVSVVSVGAVLPRPPDYYLDGLILQQVARQGSQQQITYTFQLRLNDPKTQAQVWARTLDITKQGRR
jgi:PBP1b-binding outer membrane lipoprotein LpoB